MKFGCEINGNRGAQQEICFNKSFKRNCTISTGIPNFGVWFKKWSNWTPGIGQKNPTPLKNFRLRNPDKLAKSENRYSLFLRAVRYQGDTKKRSSTVTYAENCHGGGFSQWHMVVIFIWCALFVTSQSDVILMFPNQRFREICWHNMHVLLHALPLIYVPLHWI